MQKYLCLGYGIAGGKREAQPAVRIASAVFERSQYTAGFVGFCRTGTARSQQNIFLTEHAYQHPGLIARQYQMQYIAGGIKMTTMDMINEFAGAKGVTAQTMAQNEYEHYQPIWADMMKAAGVKND